MNWKWNRSMMIFNRNHFGIGHRKCNIQVDWILWKRRPHIHRSNTQLSSVVSKEKKLAVGRSGHICDVCHRKVACWTENLDYSESYDIMLAIIVNARATMRLSPSRVLIDWVARQFRVSAYCKCCSIHFPYVFHIFVCCVWLSFSRTLHYCAFCRLSFYFGVSIFVCFVLCFCACTKIHTHRNNGLDSQSGNM